MAQGVDHIYGDGEIQVLTIGGVYAQSDYISMHALVQKRP